ncbi:uncharacterized protein E0L32_003628 [Thyridium curvatum]|uniref:Post-GPI attachment to proteins factor 3 n=1 Tax=Thyridium curvatum TaxID=1093900 RepID=A0A507BA27_9PEZI|nr:uncharacterized protein E0L32_003628 [Thyridium curvatum]TPX16687.1 hypothetical protein E0L32_003628 [Thyridium curvatum]
MIGSFREGRPRRSGGLPLLAVLLAAVALFAGAAQASVGDKSHEFRECVEVCKQENCGPGREATPIRKKLSTLAYRRNQSSPPSHPRTNAQNYTYLPPQTKAKTQADTRFPSLTALHRRLLLWDCPSECDYTCQHIITARRVARGDPVVQFHGKWPFYRLLGLQEPLSVLFSAGNLWAHLSGFSALRARVPAAYPLMPWYRGFALVGSASWVFSMVFHSRDLWATEQLDYLAAGASVLYALYFATVRVFRLDRARGATLGGSLDVNTARRAWTAACVALYVAHVSYLELWSWDYTYNMAANVAVGGVQNVLWTWFSYRRWRATRQFWAVWPGVAVAWIMAAMSLELFDFPPLWGSLDAHSLWHLGTVFPTMLWYNFLIKDAQDDIANSEKLKFKA